MNESDIKIKNTIQTQNNNNIKTSIQNSENYYADDF